MSVGWKMKDLPILPWQNTIKYKPLKTHRWAPKFTWRGNLQLDLNKLVISISQVKKISEDRVGWHFFSKFFEQNLSQLMMTIQRIEHEHLNTFLQANRCIYKKEQFQWVSLFPCIYRSSFATVDPLSPFVCRASSPSSAESFLLHCQSSYSNC